MGEGIERRESQLSAEDQFYASFIGGEGDVIAFAEALDKLEAENTTERDHTKAYTVSGVVEVLAEFSPEELKKHLARIGTSASEKLKNIIERSKQRASVDAAKPNATTVAEREMSSYDYIGRAGYRVVAATKVLERFNEALSAS